MADNKLVRSVTSRDEDFAKWYTDIVRQAQLAEYTGVRGCMAIMPNGYAIWENIKNKLDEFFKETGHENVSMPMFIPESLLNKEKDHVEGFAPEVAWVTHGGDDLLTERLCVRPTSETLFCDLYSKIIQSHRDLPKLFNQWCSVVRWEKTTRPFLRTTEFQWQEGHTAHATAEDAHEETIRMLNIYEKLCNQLLAIPVIKGKKTDKEKFAGARETYTIEALMHDGKALQSGTSHDFGDGFAKAFDITYTDKENALKYVHQTSWGLSTRIIGAIIMVHGDDDGLVLPPEVAPVQIVVIPVAAHKEGVLETASKIKDRLKSVLRVKLDDSDKTPGWKFSEHEMKGVPMRLEIGPKDIEKGQCVIVRRDNREKYIVRLDEIESKVIEIKDQMHNDMFDKATGFIEDKTFTATDMQQFEKIIAETPGFIKAMWCGEISCEEVIKEKTGATSRCIPFNQEKISDKCVCCGKESNTMVYWGKAY